jgi:hypothetical protein
MLTHVAVAARNAHMISFYISASSCYSFLKQMLRNVDSLGKLSLKNHMHTWHALKIMITLISLFMLKNALDFIRVEKLYGTYL